RPGRHRVDAREDDGMDGRRRHEEHDDGGAGEELPGDDLGIADGVRPEELERPELALLGEEPHGEERHEDEKQPLDVEHLILPEAAREIGPAHQDEEAEVRVEAVPGEDEEDGGEHVEQERAEVERELLARDGEDGHEARGPSPTRSRKTSSRPGASWRSSRTVQPRRLTASPTARSPRSPASRSRTSTTWAGSRPMVGSSRMRIGGSPSSACARPTRWRYPFESVPMRRRATPSRPHAASARATASACAARARR